ncbi:hypothetical protein CNMCM6069_007536 [Aspergillus lentulus]|nr:hypothetical protein CNMCM6069_007536 [Aspergillus lentulus]KAF4173022.1 hypothetical protein CNMCM8060_000698 [Aspergillus lentulus]KAF4184981.1 hypothetical protein CNMCM7927_007242 [Aspergillus lentulus]KAF4198325.1 hypothetical protein CNMCM8694_000443 [Aspergillus lentulus]
MAQNISQGDPRGRFTVRNSVHTSDVDIVAVPSIGSDPWNTWFGDGSNEPWLITDLTREIPNARVLLYDHGEPGARDDLNSLAHNLLKQLHQRRLSAKSRRPIFFICHSTGGLVAKAALVIASQASSNMESILSSCHGIAFFATPHQGSTYLYAPEYTQSICSIMRLKYSIPYHLRGILKPRHQQLMHLSNQFKAISADLKVWTFLETVDSAINIADSDTSATIEVHVPITSIRSGLLGLEHEKEIPLATDHVGAAYFKDQEKTTRMSFIKELQSSVSMAVRLSALVDEPLHVKKEVTIQVNGFFEDPALGVSEETPLKLWSTKVTLHDYLSRGPSECLRDRLSKTSKMPPGFLDDSSVSSFDSRRASIHSESEPDEPVNVTSEKTEQIQPTPSLKKSRSFMPMASPRIHVSEPSTESYLELGDGNISFELDEPVVPQADTPQKEDSGSEAGEVPNKSSDAKASQTRSLYKELLPVPLPKRGQRNMMGADKPRAAPRFDRPEPGSEKLLWIHIPYTHTGWVPSVLAKACADRQIPHFLSRFINEENWFSKLIRARHLEPHARYVRPSCIHSRQNDASPSNPSRVTEDPQLALYMPYLHWDTYWNLIQRRKVVQDRLRQGRSRPVPDKISKAHLEAKLIWKFLGREPPIHLRRTLDQFGYPNLRSTTARDDDQMLWKRTRKSINLKDEIGESVRLESDSSVPDVFEDGKVLMVDQLWLWILDQRTVVTFFPNQEATTSEARLYEQANLHNSIYNELNGDLARRFETAGDLAALIVQHAVTVLLDRTLHHDLQVLRIFEESISILTESVTKSFKRFRSRGFTINPAQHNKTADGRTMTEAERDERDIRVARQNREDLSALLELRDIMDELGTIMKVLEQQTTTVKTMARYFADRGYGKVFVEASLARLDEYRNQVQEMRENTILAQKAVENLLDLKQKQANVDESRLARWEAEVTQTQSRSVMVFTIFTVIFLPLSFFTSLFGINVREWSGTETNPDFRQMFLIAGPSSVAIIVIALLLAFNETLRETVAKAHAILFGMAQDFLLAPAKKFLHLSRSSEEPLDVHHEKNRFDRYLSSRRYRRQLEDDIWKQHPDWMISPLPPVAEYEMMPPGYDYSTKLRESNRQGISA